MTTSTISDWCEDFESLLLEGDTMARPEADEFDNAEDVCYERNNNSYASGGAETVSPSSTADDEIDGDDSDASVEVAIPEEFVCPLTLNVMRDPVVSKWGHSYERESIISWLVSHQSCPMTRKPLSLSGIITDHQLRSRIRKWQMEHEQDVTVLCAGSDFESKLSTRLGGYFIMPGLDDTERSTDDEDDEPRERRRSTIAAGATSNVERSMGSRYPPAWRGNSNSSGGVGRQSRRRLANNANTRASAASATGNGIASGLSRRLFGRPATAA